MNLIKLGSNVDRQLPEENIEEIVRPGRSLIVSVGGDNVRSLLVCIFEGVDQYRSNADPRLFVRGLQGAGGGQVRDSGGISARGTQDDTQGHR